MDDTIRGQSFRSEQNAPEDYLYAMDVEGEKNPGTHHTDLNKPSASDGYALKTAYSEVNVEIDF